MTDVFIIGKGPAGISAALYTARAGLSTVVTGMSSGSLGKAEKIENYYGFAEPVSGQELFESGIRGAERLGVTVLDEEVFSVSWDGNFQIVTDRGQHEADALIIAAGSVRKAPDIPGLEKFEGAGVSYCAVCDAFFHRGNDVVVIGNGAYAVSEAEHLAGVVKSVTILTNGREMEAEVPSNIAVKRRKLRNCGEISWFRKFVLKTEQPCLFPESSWRRERPAARIWAESWALWTPMESG